MKKSIIALVAALSYSVACASFSYAEESSLSSCITIKNAKVRLACYDKVAPEVIKQLSEAVASLTNKKNAEEETALKEQQKKNADEENALKEQQKLVRETLRELRKLSTATEVGINKGEYSRRVIDVASDVKLNLSEIKDEAVRNEVKVALQAFVDANDLWDEMNSSEYVSWFFEHYGIKAAKYGVAASVYPDYNDTIPRQGGVSRVLSPVWLFAKNAIDQAEAASNQVPK